MPKKIVPLISNEKYHVFNRGVDKRVVFMDKTDYLRFYQSLKFFNTVEPNLNYRLAKHRNNTNRRKLVKIEAYCLLPNHFHLILKQVHDGGISEFMKRVSTGYTGYFNEKYSRSGSLFQGVYKRVHIESEKQYMYLFAYVNENYSVHNLSTNNHDVIYSSSVHYRKLTNSLLIDGYRDYIHKEAVKLAKDIFNRREELKETLE